MAYYAYKQVRDLLPQHIIDAQGPDYEGDGNYDGDQWDAAADYIEELKAQRVQLLEALKRIVDYEHDFCVHPEDLREIARAAIAEAQSTQPEIQTDTLVERKDAALLEALKQLVIATKHLKTCPGTLEMAEKAIAAVEKEMKS